MANEKKELTSLDEFFKKIEIKGKLSIDSLSEALSNYRNTTDLSESEETYISKCSSLLIAHLAGGRNDKQIKNFNEALMNSSELTKRKLTDSLKLKKEVPLAQIEVAKEGLNNIGKYYKHATTSVSYRNLFSSRTNNDRLKTQVLSQMRLRIQNASSPEDLDLKGSHDSEYAILNRGQGLVTKLNHLFFHEGSKFWKKTSSIKALETIIAEKNQQFKALEKTNEHIVDETEESRDFSEYIKYR